MELDSTPLSTHPKPRIDMKCFKKKKKPQPRLPIPTNPNPVPEPDEDENTGHSEEHFRIADVIGHTNSSSGTATYPLPVHGGEFPFEKLPRYDGKGQLITYRKRIREYDWNIMAFDGTKEIIDTETHDIALKDFYRDGIGREGVAKEMRPWKPHIIHARHLNSIGNKAAYGFEVLFLERHRGTIGHELVRLFCTMYQREYPGVKARFDGGIKWMKPGDRGYTNLDLYAKYNKDALLVMLTEPVFVGYPHAEAKAFLEGNGPEKWNRFMAKFYMAAKKHVNM